MQRFRECLVRKADAGAARSRPASNRAACWHPPCKGCHASASNRMLIETSTGWTVRSDIGFPLQMCEFGAVGPFAAERRLQAASECWTLIRVLCIPFHDNRRSCHTNKVCNRANCMVPATAMDILPVSNWFPTDMLISPRMGKAPSSKEVFLRRCSKSGLSGGMMLHRSSCAGAACRPDCSTPLQSMPTKNGRNKNTNLLHVVVETLISAPH